MPTRRPADAENPPLTDGFGRSIFPEILSARNTGSLAIWFRHHCFVERGARELPLSPHSGNHRQLTTPHGRMQALCKARAKLPPPRHFHRRMRSKTRAVLMHRPRIFCAAWVTSSRSGRSSSGSSRPAGGWRCPAGRCRPSRQTPWCR